jgi:hypothetical protein
MAERRIKNNNAAPDLIEFVMSVISDDESELSSVHGTLRAGTAELTIDDYEIAATIRRAHIVVDLTGEKIIVGSRLGEPKKAIEISTKEVTKQQSVIKTSANVGAALGMSSSGVVAGSAEVGGKVAKDTSVTTQTESTGDVTFYRVKALGGDRWEIKEPDGQCLNETYLDGRETIFRLEKIKGANQSSIAVSVRTHKKDICVEFIGDDVGWLSRTSANKKRLLAAWIKKISLSDSQTADQYVTLSQADTLHET